MGMWIKDTLDLKSQVVKIPQLGKPYIFYKNKNIEFVIPIVYFSDGFLGLDIQKLKAKDREFVISNIHKLKFSKKQLKKYDIKNMNDFFEIQKKNWYNLNELPYTRKK